MKNTLLEDGLKKLGFLPSDRQLAAFEKYYELLIEKNKVMNLTAITEYKEVVVKHFLDSLAIKTVADSDEELSKLIGSGKVSLLDLGTGAGFPGIPIKIMFPNVKLTLMDSLNKRIKFLEEAVNELELEKVRTLHARAEEFARKPELRESFDIVVSRAVARMATLTEFCFSYVKTGGYFLPYKASGAGDEIKEAENAVGILGGKLLRTEKVMLPESDIIRMIPVIKKLRATPEKYPRLGKKAETQPL